MPDLFMRNRIVSTIVLIQTSMLQTLLTQKQWFLVMISSILLYCFQMKHYLHRQVNPIHTFPGGKNESNLVRIPPNPKNLHVL